MATNDVPKLEAPTPPDAGAVTAIAPPTPQLDRLAVVDNRPVEIQKFEFQQRCAKLFAASGLFSDIKGTTQESAIAQAFVKIALGDSMGFNPAESMTGIDIIQGRPAIGASIRAARMQRAGYSWDILQLDDKGCRLRLYFKGKALVQEEVNPENDEVSKVPAIVSFTAEDAARAGLIAKDNYKKNPRNMFFARAITNAQRWYAPGILGVEILDTEEAITIEAVPAEPTNDRLAGRSSSRLSEALERATPKPAPALAATAGTTENPPQTPASPAAVSSETPAPKLSPEQAVEKIVEHQRARRGRGPDSPISESQGLPGVFENK